jgi:hypothetical protein
MAAFGPGSSAHGGAVIHYHGTPLSSAANSARVLAGRHALVSFATCGNLVPVIAEACQSFVLDNGAFTAWRQGKPVTDWAGYYEWSGQWLRHPGCDWAVIPDVIDGSEADNDRLLLEWPHGHRGVPVFHLHESLTRLERLVSLWPRVAFGSSGEWSMVGSGAWWQRMDAVLGVACDGEGYPRCKLHGLRMLNPTIFTRLPLASADSCNAGRNCGEVARNLKASPDAAAELIVRRIEAHNSAACWAGLADEGQGILFSTEAA